MLLDKLFAWWVRAESGKRERSAVMRQRPLHPRLDLLEGRELLDGGIGLVAGTITIQGTAAVNYCLVSYTDASHATVAVTCNGAVAEFNSAAVNAIQFNGQNASMNEFENETTIASTAIGGNGTNVFMGESGDDTFIGGNGFNLFWVAGGNDTLVGGSGANFFIGVSGNDTYTTGPGGFTEVTP